MQGRREIFSENKFSFLIEKGFYTFPPPAQESSLFSTASPAFIVCICSVPGDLSTWFTPVAVEGREGGWDLFLPLVPQSMAPWARL